jgi:hypothetical protein
MLLNLGAVRILYGLSSRICLGEDDTGGIY